MVSACKVAVRDNERTRTAYLSMLVMCLCIRLIYVKINSYICVNKKEKHLASPYVYVNLMQQGCQINDNSTRNAFGAYSNLSSNRTRNQLGLQNPQNR